jgi:hypothetical protein
VQPCGELHCASNARHVPITLAMKTSKNVLHFLEELKNIENRVAWFLAELCKTQKGVQKDKRNQFSVSPES